jgi:hypothetical protein
MKHCPACHSQYEDVTLRFCLHDGTPLVGEIRQSAIETLAFNRAETAEKILQTAEIKPAEGKTRRWQAYPQNPAQAQAQAKKSGSFVRLAVLSALLGLVAVGAGVWFFVNERNAVEFSKTNAPEPFEKTLSANTAALSVQRDTEKTSGEESEIPAETKPEQEALKKEIADFVDSWKKAAEARNLAEYLGKYAGTVDYHDKTAAGIAEVRADAQKIFSSYEEIIIEITNLRVAVDADGSRATTVFDREWDYETNSGLVEGKAHTKLQLQKINGAWKITGEKNLKIYYLED